MRHVILASAVVAALALGCGKEESRDQPAPGTGTPAATPSDPFAALGAADAALAKAQKTCPVSDEELGGMGTPVKIEVKGRTVFLCCNACKSKILADPDKYLAKLDKAK